MITAQSPTAAPRPTSRSFTFNFTLTNLRYTADLNDPNSRKFKSTVKVMNYYVSLALLVPLLGHGDDLNLPALNSGRDSQLSIVLFF